jgi:hypothetical protein
MTYFSSGCSSQNWELRMTELMAVSDQRARRKRRLFPVSRRRTVAKYKRIIYV